MFSAQTDPVRLLIVERQPVVTPEVRSRLVREPGFAVVGRVGSAVEASRFGRDQSLDMVLVESTLPEPGAVEMARFFKVRKPKTVIVFVTRAFSQPELFEAARVGAAAYLRASTDADLFIATLRRAAAGQFPIDEDVVRFPSVAARILAEFRETSSPAASEAPVAPEPAVAKAEPEALGPLFVKLSPREIEILDLVARGNSNKIIGRKLSISDQTVKNHVSAILRKLEVNDRTEAVVYALRNGWIRIEAPTS
ncbi:MAG: response regulator transcription factor [Chloroflexi bacterium]|nr:response regulator transcription factor [Chloroflexota bacterium]MBV9892886.1 response regulator transcription factor [Chloroflexota bacterium]